LVTNAGEETHELGVSIPFVLELSPADFLVRLVHVDVRWWVMRDETASREA
jgi:hypothetical protein